MHYKDLDEIINYKQLNHESKGANVLKKLTLIILILLFSACSWLNPTIKVVLIGNFQDSGRDFSVSSFSGVELAIKQLELDDRIEIDAIDIAKYDNAEDLEQAMIDSEATIFIGPNNSSDLTLLYPIIERNEFFTFIPTASSDDINMKDDYVFRFITSTTEQALQFSNLLKDKDYHHILILYENANLAYTQVLAQGIQRTIPNRVTSTEYVDYNTTQEMLESYLSTQIDAIVLIASAQSSGVLVQRMRLAHVDLPIYLSSWARSQTLMDYVAKATENMYIYSNGFPTHMDHYQSLNMSYHEVYGEDIGLPALYSYEFIYILKSYLDLGHRVNKQDFKDYLVENPLQDGYLFNLELNEFGLGQQAMQLLEIQDGLFVKSDH